MVALRKIIIEQIYDRLERSNFSVRDFKVDLEKRGCLLHLSFLPHPQYEFSIIEKEIATGLTLITVESPGEYKIRDSRIHKYIAQCVNRITEWCTNINDELSAQIPIQEEIEDFEAEIERRINEMAGNAQDGFSDSEIAILSKKLDGFATKFEELEKAKEITEKELNKIKAELEKMKNTLALYPKSTWYKTAGHKLLDLTKSIVKTKEVRDFLLSAAKKALLE